MKKIIGLLLAFVLALPAFPQAQPKPSPSPTPQATPQATTPGPCPADYYRNVNSVCVHRPVQVHPPNVGTAHTRSLSTGEGPVHTMEEWRSGCKKTRGGDSTTQSKTTIYFQDHARNVTVGGTLRITGRGLGVVESILNKDYEMITICGEKLHVTKILRVCLRFDDQNVGCRMFSWKDRLQVPGYGTYLPSGEGQEIVWRMLF
jgi:hypothetical protein